MMILFLLMVKNVFNVVAKIYDISQTPCGENVEYFSRFY